jgi:Family of unknown function (DUF6069)
MTVTAPSATTSHPTRAAAAAPLAVTAATAAAAAVWLAAWLSGTELRVTPPGQPSMVVALPAVVGTALAAGLVGWAALAVLRRVTRRARTLWTGLALAALAVSFAPVLSVQASAGVRAFLALMHVVVAAVLVPGLRRACAGPLRSAGRTEEQGEGRR